MNQDEQNAIATDGYATQYKKRLTTKVVLPFMSVGSLLYVVTYYQNNFAENLTLALAVISVAMNAFMSSKERVINLGFCQFNTRSEVSDAVRWIYNLAIYDTILFYTFKPPLAGLGSAWVVVIMAAQADLFQRKYKTLVVSVGLIAANLMLFLLYTQNPLMERLLNSFVMTSLILIFGLADSFWVKEINQRVRAQRIEQELMAETERLKFDALLGEKLKFIMHEINNLLFVLEMTNKLDGADAKREIYNRTHDKLKNISKLVLGQKEGVEESREISIQEVLDDLQILAFNKFKVEQVRVELKVSSEASHFRFQERKGSLFYVLFNILKNSREALDLVDNKRRVITFEADISASDCLQISIKDQGPGMSETQQSAILSGEGATTKATGHGIGMRFVRLECQKNNFKLSIPKSSPEGTEFLIEIGRFGKAADFLAAS
ncbi:MAG: ATP-binding protein [Proteobacteria bacterium]|nr:ATP-binding protein [Pseudomonadota bacterium]